MGSGRLLHVGCGNDPLPEWAKKFDEVRLDINDEFKPDIIADMLDMGDIGTFDALLCQHALEHVYPHQVGRAVSEFYRVLKPGGYAMVFVPDLEDVKATEDVLFESPAGPITGLDLIYGYRNAIMEYPRMAHHTGFTSETFSKVFKSQGFSKVETKRLFPFNLMLVAVK